MIKTLSAAIAFSALVFFATPLVNVVMLPMGSSGFIISGAILFSLWLLLIIASFLNARGAHKLDNALGDTTAHETDHA